MQQKAKTNGKHTFLQLVAASIIMTLFGGVYGWWVSFIRPPRAKETVWYVIFGTGVTLSAIMTMIWRRTHDIVATMIPVVFFIETGAPMAAGQLLKNHVTDPLKANQTVTELKARHPDLDRYEEEVDQNA